MPVESLEIEGACTEPEHPAPDRARHDAALLGDARHGDSLGEHLRDRIHDDLDAGDLARQRLARQHSLAVPTTAAARQRHRQRDKRVTGLEPPLDSTASQPEVASTTRGTSAVGEDLITGAVDDRGVAARLDVEYEDHVLMTAPG